MRSLEDGGEKKINKVTGTVQGTKGRRIKSTRKKKNVTMDGVRKKQTQIRHKDESEDEDGNKNAEPGKPN